ncbi:hypothetical protein U1Q18_012978 [Sarracenia purpurea var. burkii]
MLVIKAFCPRIDDYYVGTNPTSYGTSLLLVFYRRSDGWTVGMLHCRRVDTKLAKIKETGVSRWFVEGNQRWFIGIGSNAEQRGEYKWNTVYQGWCAVAFGDFGEMIVQEEWGLVVVLH